MTVSVGVGLDIEVLLSYFLILKIRLDFFMSLIQKMYEKTTKTKVKSIRIGPVFPCRGIITRVMAFAVDILFCLVVYPSTPLFFKT